VLQSPSIVGGFLFAQNKRFRLALPSAGKLRHFTPFYATVPRSTILVLRCALCELRIPNRQDAYT